MEGERRRAHPGKNGGERDLSPSLSPSLPCLSREETRDKMRLIHVAMLELIAHGVIQELR